MNYDSVLEMIKPSKADEEKILLLRETVIKSISAAASSSGVKVEVVAGGSTAKGTFLKGDHDIDLFVRFITPLKDLSTQLELFLTDFATEHDVVIERIHGSRDYFTFFYEDLFFEVVPVKYVDDVSQVENVTDMSPLHVQWIQKFITPQLQDDIRLAKQFCKSALVYGAESYINGVSGHVLDILLIHYGSFDNWVKAVASWSGVTVIDPNKEYDDVFKSLNQSKLVSPLIVIDPVDKERNAAAALSLEKYNNLIYRCNAFLQDSLHAKDDFFIIPDFDKDVLKKKMREKESLFLLSVTPLKGKKDVVATKILKVFEFIDRHLQLHDFEVRDANWFYTPKMSYLYFYVNNEDLEETVIRIGPPLNLEEDVQRFKDAHIKHFEEDGRICAPTKREFTSAHDCFLHLVKSSYVKERVSSADVSTFE